jgi:hypothetical protein
MHFRSELPAALVAACLALFLPAPGAAQQFVTDDAAIADRGACQLEAWHGRTESRIEPACTLLPNMELTAGVGWIDEGGPDREVEWALEAMYLFREMAPGRVGVGLIAGFGLHPSRQATDERLEEVFAFVPMSYTTPGERLILHANLGWHYETDHDHGHTHGHAHDQEGGHHALTWGLRADVPIPVAADRFTLIGELFGEDRLLPEFQIGVRTALLADRLAMDVSWGGHTQDDLTGYGWVVGLAWTPPPFVRAGS